MSKTKIHIQLTPAELKRFESIKTMLEKERKLHPSDMDAIALMCVNISMLSAAQDDINVNGYLIKSGNGIVKGNPAIQILENGQKNLRGLMGELLMSPKAKIAIAKEMSETEDEEEDPISSYKRNK